MSSTDPALAVSNRYPGAEAPTYAGFLLRFVAVIIDSMLFAAIAAPVLHHFYGFEYWVEKSPELSRGTPDRLMSWVFPAVATILFWVYRRATPGKMLFNLEVVDADTGSSVSTGRLILRYFSYFLSALPLCLGFIWVLFDKRKQGWHDKIAGTLVIRRPRA